MRVLTLHLPDTGVRVKVADSGTRILHNFIHNQIQDRAHAKRRLNLRQLLDFAGLIQHNRAELDWPALLHRLQPRHHRTFRLYLLAAEHWLGEPYPNGLRRPLAGRSELQLIALAQSSTGWYRFFGVLPRLRNLPGRLLTPSWYPMKIRALRRGDRW